MLFFEARERKEAVLQPAHYWCWKRLLHPSGFFNQWCNGEGSRQVSQETGLSARKKRNISYSEAISFIRCRIRFSILGTALISLRGFRGNSPAVPSTLHEDSDIDFASNRHQMHFWRNIITSITSWKPRGLLVKQSACCICLYDIYVIYYKICW